MNGTDNALHVEALVTPLYQIVKRFNNRSCAFTNAEICTP